MGIPKFVTAKEAVTLIKNGDTLASAGYIGMGHAEELTYELEKRFLETGEPRDLTVTWGSSQSTNRNEKIGCNRFAHDGFIKRAIVGHLGMQYDLCRMAKNNQFEIYNIPQGVLMHLYRAKGGNKPCVITTVGLGTFIDPRECGGKMNELTLRQGPDMVKLIEIDDKEYLMYKTFPIDVVFIRATSADEKGNLTMEKEGLLLENLALAYAAKASGGIVIAQVERVVKAGTLHPQMVKVPGVVVDYVVKCSDTEKFHMQSYKSKYNPLLSGESHQPNLQNTYSVINLNLRKIICRRALFEIKPHDIISLGVGIPAELGICAVEEKIDDLITTTIEPSPIGGVPCIDLEFGCATNVEALVDHPYQFDFYDGGGLDEAFLGMAEVDAQGNVNVCSFGDSIYGVGGFVNISQSTEHVTFMGTFTCGGLEAEIRNGSLHIKKEGSIKKFVSSVESKSFCGKYADHKTKILYITERAVFALTKNGLELREIAPGIDLQKDILDQMDFMPIISPEIKLMDARIFSEQLMSIRDEIQKKG